MGERSINPRKNLGLEKALESDSAPAAQGPRPTVIPSFDPRTYAEEFETRERMPTITDESAIEQARLHSFPTNIPPPQNAASTAPPGRDPAAGRDSIAEIDQNEFDFDALPIEEQIAILTDRLMPFTRVPLRVQPMTRELLDDANVVFAVGFVDGVLSLGTIVDVIGLPELEVLRAFDRLVALGIVVFDT